jgi:CheY-like chemotaxis protein
MLENARPRLLAVDDSPEFAELVGRIAERSGYEAFVTSRSRNVAAMVQEARPDVLTMDLCMPEIDAIELFKVLRAAAFKGYVVIISGQQDALRRSAAKLASVNGLEVVGNLQKPVRMAELRELLTHLRLRLAA